MNKIITILALALLPLAASAQTFLSNGKTWNMSIYHLTTPLPNTASSYFLDGDTICAGLEGNKMYHHNIDGNNFYLGAWREEGGRVWVLPVNGEKWVKAYDFNLKEGDEETLTPLGAPEEYQCHMKVLATKTIEIKGVNRRVIYNESYPLYNPEVEPEQHIWVEGIGDIIHLYRNLSDGSVWGMTANIFETCVENCKVIFDKSDRDKVQLALGVENLTQNPKLKTQNQYNLQGQTVGEEYKGIVVRNGRKVLRK